MLRIVMAAAIAALGAQVSAQEPAPPGAEFAFEEVVKLLPAVEVGKTSRGNRRYIPIVGGRFEGPGIKGTIVPGGWDWQLDRADGCLELKADYFIKTDDGVTINVVNQGTICPGQSVRTHPVFEAPIGPYDWLNKAAFFGTLEVADPADGPAVRIRFYRMK